MLRGNGQAGGSGGSGQSAGDEFAAGDRVAHEASFCEAVAAGDHGAHAVWKPAQDHHGDMDQKKKNEKVARKK